MSKNGNERAEKLRDIGAESSDEYESPLDLKTDQQERSVESQSVKIKESEATVSAIELESEDSELWLISVPRHDSVRATLPGSKLRFPKSEAVLDLQSAHKNKGVGVLQGSYVYREHVTPLNGNMRAVFVVKDESGNPSLKIAKPFSKTISVAFDTEMDEGDHPAPSMQYPQMPEGLQMKYFPIGSKKRCHQENSDNRTPQPEGKKRKSGSLSGR